MLAGGRALPSLGLQQDASKELSELFSSDPGSARLSFKGYKDSADGTGEKCS